MTAFALNNLLNYLQGLTLSQNEREWLAQRLIMPITTTPTDNTETFLDKFWGKLDDSDAKAMMDAIASSRREKDLNELVDLKDTGGSF